MPKSESLILGWREWIVLPDLDLPPIKAKVDTGARTSALHAFEIRPFFENGIQCIEFFLHPRQRDNDTVARCIATVTDKREVTDSGGHTEERWVIQTSLSIGSYAWPIDVTLTSRDNMRFRMLLGREAIKNRAMVDPARSYQVGKKPSRKSRR